MKSDKPKRYTSLVMTVFIIFSAFAVLNITSINVSATDYNLYSDLIIDRAIWNESDTITLHECNLIIEDGGILTYNDSVELVIISDYPGHYGIIIESGGQFIINSASGNTVIKSDPDYKYRTYPFLNSGTIDFLGATVERVYGDSNNPDTTGGIRNLPGSMCNLTNCNIMDGDTHGVYVEGNSALK